MNSSLKGYFWKLPSIDYSKKYKSLLSFLSEKREVFVEDPLSSSVRRNWPSIKEIPDLEKGIRITSSKIKGKEKIIIIGDYDVDGICGTSVLLLFLKSIGHPTEYLIPNRFKDGYGANERMVEEADNKGAKLIITIDNGSSAYKAIEKAKELGIDFIIIDHHIVEKDIEVSAFINPHREEKNKYKNSSAAVLVYIFIVFLKKRLVEEGIKVQEDCKEYLDLVSLSIISDMVAISGLNRGLLSYGLKKINEHPNKGLKYLLQDKKSIDESFLAFYVNPIINASGRYGFPEESIELFINPSEEKAAYINLLNHRRKKEEKEIVEEAMSIIDIKEKFIVVSGDWNEGIIGSVAGKIKEKYNKPCCVISTAGEIAKGSLRSTSEFNITILIKEALDRGIIEKGGGHFMAGGISLKKENINNLISLWKEISFISQKKELNIDAIISLKRSENILEELSTLSPYGVANPEPYILFPYCYVYDFRIINNKHIFLSLYNSTFTKRVKAVAFSVHESKISHIIQQGSKPIDIVAQIKKNHKNEVQLVIQDACLSINRKDMY